VATSITAMTDALVGTLAQRAFVRAGATPAEYDKRIGVFAVGGYGRGEMNPSSDLDLLVLHDDARQPEWVKAGNAELQTLLWDVGFQVGASMRSLGDLEKILREDFVTATAVIEQRRLAGAPAHSEGLARVLEAFRRKRLREFLHFKIVELQKRRDQAGASLFLMEPNLKSNPGCLRDVQLLRNIAFMVFGSRNLLSLVELEVITRKDLSDVVAANDHLLALRSLNHFHHKRKHDTFQLADQLRIAKQLGYADVSQLRAVEHLMRRHYALVLHVHQTIELTLSRLRALGHLGSKPILVLSRKVLDQDFTAVEGRVYLSDKLGFWRKPDAGARLIRMCRTAQSRDLRIALELQRDIRANLGVVGDEVRHDPASGRVFLEILGDVGRARPILQDMHNCGLLGAYLPEFGNITCHMQFDSYHQYTVDEHTLIAVGNLDAVARGQAPGLPGMARIFPAIRRKDLLVLGLLLHDAGKYMGRGHVARGAMMVAPVARRLGLDEAEEEIVWFLVERHVALSDASRMRDFREPGFLRAFTERIGDEERLDLLYCLTYADARAVGEGILTGWQEELLSEIREAVRGELGRVKGVAAPSHHERLRAELVAAGHTTEQAEGWLRELPDTYLYQVAPGDAAKHLAVIDEARRTGVGLHRDLKDGTCVYLTAALADRHALFADVTATLTGNLFDILDTRTWVTTAGMVVYNFRLTSATPARLKDEGAWSRLRADLRLVTQGTLDTKALLAKRKAAIGAPKAADSRFDDPAVKVEQRTSDHHTIVDIHAKDQPGLLSNLCRAISDYGCNITYACINTMGDVAVDVFYVDRDRRKLADEDAEGLRQHLISALDLAPIG
jgi:[protein-PII] uridylyltransferase